MHVVWDLAFSADGKRLASAGWDGSVRVWDAATGKELHNFRGHTDRVLSVAFSPDGKRLASGSCDNTAKLWDVETGQEAATLRDTIGYVQSVAFTPDGKRLAVASGHRSRGEVQLWDTAALGTEAGPGR
jgi:WD40 repeat protein